jgi:heptosyltransferase-2
MTTRSRILIFHTAFVGDIVLTLPVAQVIRDTWPDAHIVFVAIPAAAAVLRNHPSIDDVIEFDKRGADRGPGGFVRIVRLLSALQCQVALVPHRSLRSALAVWCARIPRRIGFSRSAGKALFTDVVPYNPGAHETERNLALLDPLGIRVRDRVPPRLYPDGGDVRSVDALLRDFRAPRGKDALRPTVALAPGSVWFTKRWPEEHFLTVARALLQDGMQVVLVGGADDAALCTRIAEGCGEGAAVRNAAGRLSLLQSAELLRRCALLVSNDSAPMHLAGAVGTPVFALFGATVPSFGFAPLGPHDHVFELQGLACRPCGIHGGQKCPIGTFVCMRDLTPASLLAPIREFLSQHRVEN